MRLRDKRAREQEKRRKAREKQLPRYSTWLTESLVVWWVLFAVPGSPGACKDAWDDILVFQLDIRHMPCNFVELMPRLREHENPN